MNDAGPDLIADALALSEGLEEIRADIHRHPELSWRETRTTRRVTEHLEQLGLEVKPFQGMTGLTADVVLGDGPVVALRADLDALPIDDLTGPPARSVVPGVSHACGHDVHTAALLGAAELLLKRTGTSAGVVRLVFQPAEEAIPGGAPAVLASGRLADVSAIYALHCDPSLPVGSFGVRSGAITSAADRLHLVLNGRGGHTARPQLTEDIVSIVAGIASRIPSEVTAAMGDELPVSIVFGHIEAGTAPNVIPSRAVLEGTLRTPSKAAWEAAPAIVRRCVSAHVEQSGVAWDLLHERGNPPVVNHAGATELAHRTLSALVGDGRIVEAGQSAGSEDFSWYLEQIPGSYVRLGVAASDEPASDLHRGDFDVAPGSVAHGAAALAALALGTVELRE